jgi:dipeptidyl aminopeptidase/acylaminoacyl peptidase
LTLVFVGSGSQVSTVPEQSPQSQFLGHPIAVTQVSRIMLKFVTPIMLSFVICMGSEKLMGDDTGYQLPPDEVVKIIDADPEPAVSFSLDTEWIMLIERSAMPDIADVSRRMLRLGGLRIDPAANSTFQTGFQKGLKLRRRGDSPNVEAVRIPLAEGAKLASVSWAHDSRSFAFTVVTDQGQQLWAATVEDPTHPKMLTDQLSTVTGGFDWMPDAQHILCKLVPSDRGAEPSNSNVPTGPNIQESSGNTSPTRTYQDLLSNQSDEELFEYYAKSQLALIGLDGTVKKVGQPQIFSDISVAPNGQQVLVTTVHKPFSYLMTYQSFPRKIQVWDLDGNMVHEVADLSMDENIPIEGVRTGPRNVDWKTGEAATLMWVEALDGGDPNVEAEHRDRIMSLSAPFDGDPNEMVKVEHRAFGVSFFSDPTLISTMEYDRDRRWIRSLMHDLDSQGSTPKVLMDRSIRDRYGDPGRMATVPDETGRRIVRQDGDWVYRIGMGASPKGNLPFVDRQNLKTLETERLWRCEEGVYEAVVAIAQSNADSEPVVITDSETPTTPPNYFIRNLNENSRKPITDFQDPTPQIRGIKKQLVKYEREDGVPLSATLYLPADYVEGTRLPLLVWAYPREFNDAKTAGQISGSPHRFTTMRSITHLTLLTQGYAIMDAATMPVIGDPETMNDTFIEQIVGAAQAAIDKAVEMGVADRDRVCVGGHSYGAFMTANLLAHCDLFKAGVARSGAYNRTLTPFGFQSERRPFWEAKDVYFNISPFMHANKINEPLLLIHGEADNNSGTFPIQSKRLYQAIKGNGGTARLCMLPHESHGYRARQSVLHTQYEMIAWFDKYVKNPESDRDAPDAQSEIESVGSE